MSRSFVVLISVLWAVQGQEYLSWCDSELCADGRNHIACNNSGEFHETCEPDAEMIDLTRYRDFILHEHNKRRNFIALGLLPGYYPAARMATQTWDKELELLASLNLKTCVVEHDECNNSHRYRNVGQNLCGIDGPKSHTNIKDIILQSMGLWFGEYPLIDSSFITNFRVTPQLEKYGHFAQLVVDRSTHIGCSMIRYTHPYLRFLYIYNFACNYASGYAVGVPIYRTGEPASECATGANPKYIGLCSKKEKFNPNYNEY